MVNMDIMFVVLGSMHLYLFHFQMVKLVKNIIIFGANIISWRHIDTRSEDMLILGEGPTQRLDDTVVSTGAIYSINITRSIQNRMKLYYEGKKQFFVS